MLTFCCKVIISIHAPSRERQPSQLYVQHHPYHFNPRSLAGATNGIQCGVGFAAISIHAPSRERLLWIENSMAFISISIHAPSRERLGGEMSTNNEIGFQSTLPRGSDLIHSYYGSFNANFNPRSLAGATTSCQRRDFADINFNPRSLAGATCILTRSSCIASISIHAPSRERPTQGKL